MKTRSKKRRPILSQVGDVVDPGWTWHQARQGFAEKPSTNTSHSPRVKVHLGSVRFCLASASATGLEKILSTKEKKREQSQGWSGEIVVVNKSRLGQE